VSGDVASSGRSQRLEVVATVLLAFAAVGTAWSSYQAARWTAEQTKAFGAANAARAEASQSSALANSQTQIDVAVFIQWVEADQKHEADLADFYQTRFRAEFIPAFRAWLGTDPFRDPDAPLTPFAMPEYRVAKAEEAARLNGAAEASAADAREFIQRATNYVLGVVLFAVALFFAAVSTKLTSPRLRTTVLLIGCVVLLATLTWIATSPVSISI
jgi:hypothetical protein